MDFSVDYVAFSSFDLENYSWEAHLYALSSEPVRLGREEFVPARQVVAPLGLLTIELVHSRPAGARAPRRSAAARKRRQPTSRARRSADDMPPPSNMHGGGVSGRFGFDQVELAAPLEDAPVADGESASSESGR